MVGHHLASPVGAGSACPRNGVRAPVRYESDIGAYQTAIEPFLPQWLVFDLGLMLAEVSEHGMLGSTEELDALTSLLGRPPRSYDDYVAECVATWQAPVF